MTSWILKQARLEVEPTLYNRNLMQTIANGKASDLDSMQACTPALQEGMSL